MCVHKYAKNISLLRNLVVPGSVSSEMRPGLDKNVIFIATIVTFVTIIVYYKYYSQNEVTRFAITCSSTYYLDTIYITRQSWS